MAILHPYPLLMNTHQIDKDHWHSDTCYAFLATGDPSMSIQAGESLDLRWYSYSELMNIPDSEISSNARETYEFMFKTPLSSWEAVDTSYFTM